MTSAKKLSTIYQTINILVTIGLLLIGPFIINYHVSAQPVMNHGMQTTLSCFSGCANNQGTVLRQDVVLDEDKNTPIPPPDEPHRVHPQVLNFPEPPLPKNLIISSSFIPPDLNILHAIFRI